MIKQCLKIISIASLFSFSLSLFSANLPSWKILPNQSNITFTAIQNHAPVSGQFKRFNGKIIADTEHYQASEIEINIDIASLTASYRDLVSMLLSAEWFDVKKYPTATFKANNFKKINENTYLATGELTIRDKTSPLTLTFTLEKNTQGYAIVQGYTTIKRTFFGVGQGSWAETDTINDEVKITFKIAAQKVT
ncbi:YceI family protein [Legionella sp. D16C41]|uniref:YceI family protein n=1 Tax=Legionella sp. D16C41 TaxID=3402688 RepID=UPI003AF7A65F